MASGEVQYSFRTSFPDVVVRERENVVQMSAHFGGVVVSPLSPGVFTLLDSSGNVISTSTFTLVGDIATATIPAVDLPDTLDFSQRYQERWSLDMPDGSSRIIPREAALSRFQLSPPADAEQLLDEYPGLLTEFAGSVDSLQPFVDSAWGKIIRALWAVGTWPDIIVSESQLVDPLQQKAYYLIFKALFRKTSGVARWKELMDEHKDNFGTAWGKMTFKVDRDHDGLADSDERRGNSTLVHRNVAPRRTRSRDPRW